MNTRAQRSPLRIQRAILNNWRNFVYADVALGQRMFFIGPNAAGKSNFLDVLRFLQDIVVIGGGLEEAIRKRGGVSDLRCLAARRFPNVGITIELATDDLEVCWRYELEFGEEKSRKAARPLVQKERVEKNGRVMLSRPDSADERDPERLTQTYLEQVQANQQFREIAEFLRTVHYLHIVPQLVREPDRLAGRANDPYGGDFLERVASTPDRTRSARLQRIGDALRVAVPQLKELELVRDLKGVPHLRGKYEHWRPQGKWQTERDFSDGTLRLLGLLWAILDGGGPLLLEEPELSLHAEVVRFIPQMFERAQRKSGRQVFVSTHSAQLLLDEGIGLEEVLLLRPSAEGTTVSLASSDPEIRALVEGGVSVGEAVIPWTGPERVERLSLFAS